jgi:hypothetical protein
MKLVQALSIASALTFSFALAACGSHDESSSADPNPTSSTDEAISSADEDAESAAEGLAVPPGCHWRLRPGPCRDRQPWGSICKPAPRHPGYHWQEICPPGPTCATTDCAPGEHCVMEGPIPVCESN